MDSRSPIETFADKFHGNDGAVVTADTSALEQQIDEMVYELYGLTPEEIAIVEGKG